MNRGSKSWTERWTRSRHAIMIKEGWQNIFIYSCRIMIQENNEKTQPGPGHGHLITQRKQAPEPMHHLRNGHEDCILNKKVLKLTTESLLYYDYTYEGENRQEGHHILHTLRTILACKILNITVMFWHILHYRHHTLAKRYCKDGLYKSQSILISEDCRCRGPVGNYRKFTLWLRIRDCRDEDKIVNCNQY